VEGCTKMVTLLQPNSFVETVSKDQQGAEMEESIYANWVMPQRKHEACDYSPSRLLLGVDTQWACGGGPAEAGAAGKGWFGPKAQFGSKEGEYPIVAAPLCNLMGATGGILSGGGVASGSFAMPLAAAGNVDIAMAVVVSDVCCEVLECEGGRQQPSLPALSVQPTDPTWRWWGPMIIVLLLKRVPNKCNMAKK